MSPPTDTTDRAARPTRRRMMGAALTVLALAALVPAVAAPAPARADENAEARVLFERGNRRLEEAYRHRGEERERLLREALEAYVETLRIVRSRNAVFNAGVTLEALGRLEDAYAYFREYVAMPGLDAEERRAGQARLDALRPRVAVVIVESEPPGAAVRVDRRDLAPVAETPAEIAVPPGERVLFLEAGGHRPAEVRVSAAPGQTSSVEVALDPLAAPDRAPPPPSPATVALRVETEGVGAAGDAVTYVDGAVAGRGAGLRIARPPGPLTLRVEAPGHLPVDQPLTLAAGAAVRVDAFLAASVEGERRFDRWPAVLGVAAVAAAGAYLGLGLWARDLDAQLGPGPYPPEQRATYDRLRRVAYAADGMAATAAVLALTAIVLGLLNGDVEQPPSTARVVPSDGAAPERAE